MTTHANSVSSGVANSFDWRYPTTQTPDDSFYRQFQVAYADSAASLEAADSSALATPLQYVLGQDHVESVRRAGVSAESQASYAKVLNRAYASNAMADPQKFLLSLSMQEAEAVRINHGLAEAFNAGQLSREGATNLLLPRGYSVDINNDGLEEVGAARTMHFPPRDAPAEFVEKWREATADMDPGEQMTHCFEMHAAIYGFHLDGVTSAVHPASEVLETYRTAIKNLLENTELSKHLNTTEWYERNKAFYLHLQTLIA